MRLKTYIFSFGLLCLLFTSTFSIAQNFSNQHWYFGNTTEAVEFTRPNGVPVLVSDYKVPPFNINGKGNATANRPETGDLIFYTDGFDVFDLTYSTMAGISISNKLDADVNKNQSVAISTAPQNGSNELYYIFTNTPSGAIHYSEVDMTSNGNAITLQPPLGSVISMNNTIANSTANASDAMLVISDSTNGYWLITLDQGTNNYKVLGIDSDTPGTWLENTYPLGAAMNAAHITYNADSSKIAVAPKDPNINIQLLDIDLSTGVLTFDKEIPNSGVANVGATGEAIFDVSFSNDGSKLYYSIYGDGVGLSGNLMQFDLLDTTIVLAPQSVIPSTIFGSYGLQKGPDGNLYHLYQQTNGGPFLIGSLTDIDSVASLTTYTPAIENGQDFNSFQFPAFLPNRPPIFTSLSFTTAGNCANAPTTFYPQVSPAPTRVVWDFGDGSTSTDLAPFYTYTAAYAGDVTLTAFLNGQSQSVSIPTTITDFQLQLTLPQDTVACKCELPIYAPISCTPFSVTVQAQGGSGAETYVWSNGETGTTLHPNEAGYYYVIATDGACSTYAGVEVQEYDVDLLPYPGISPSSRANVWYFGNQAGIDFTGGATAITDGQMDAMEGCTAVSDLNGQIIFYTDGDVLFDQTHTQIDSGLGGTPNATGTAAQSVVSVAVPGDETLFYIFTTQNTDPSSPDYNFSYSLFDLKQNNGLGAVVEKSVVLFNKSTERVTASANWVVIHEYGNNNFRAYPISAAGIGNAVVSSVGEDYSIIAAENGKGYMKLGGTILALAVVENNNGTITNFLDVFDFDASSGEVSNLKRANLTADGATGSAYGIEISGAKIFVSLNNGGSSQIMEYWIDYLDNLNLNTPIMLPGLEVGAIQTGPDGQIYVAENGNGSLGTISPNGDTLQASTYTPSSFPLAGKTSQLGLPNFIQQTGTSGSGPGISVSSPACFGQTIYLSVNATSSIDEVIWQIFKPDGTSYNFTSTQLMDSLTILEDPTNPPGTYTASVQINNRCLQDPGFALPSVSFEITAPPQVTDLPPSTFLCGGGTTLDPYINAPGNIADLDFAWSTGETTQAITVSAQGNYSVLITNRLTQCNITASIFVGPPIPIDVGEPQDICEGGALTLDAQVNADTYSWSINGVSQPGTRFFDVGAQNLTAGSYTIQVDATIDLGGSLGPCTVTDQVIITVNPTPVFTGIQTAPTTCGNASGQISVDITSTGTFDYTIANESGTLTGPSVGNPISNIPAGNNVLTLTNTSSLCVQTAIITVIDDALFEITTAAAVDATCARNDGQITFDVGTGAIGSFRATVIDINNPALVYTQDFNPGGNGSFVFNSPTPIGLPPGDYVLEIQEDGGLQCTAIWINGTNPPIAQTLTISSPLDADLQVTQNPIVNCSSSIRFDQVNNSGIPVTSSSAGVVLEWSSVNDFSSDVNPITQPYTTTGDNLVYFRASALNLCPVIQQANVLLTPPPTVVIDTTGNICDGQLTLTARVTNEGYPGALSAIGFRWNTGEITQSINITQTGSYEVVGYHGINPTCSSTPAIYSDPIPAPFTVSISTPGVLCNNGQPFTLTANVNGSVTNPTYEWFYNGQGNGRTKSSEIYLDAGVYKVITNDVRATYTCSQEAEFTVTLFDLTPTDLPSAGVFCSDDSLLVLDAGPNFVSYLWSTGSTEQSIQVSTGGLYELEATNSFGCVTFDQSEAIEDCIPVVSGPNAFRPGGVNTTYGLFYKYIDTFEIFIYNRWGELVFTSQDKDFKWDGNTPVGEPAPAGQYSWVVRYTSSFRDRGTIEQYGGVMLLR